jgi:hypothetical protein
MEINFTESPQPEPAVTFNMVRTNQFFVSQRGRLCQKIASDAYSMIAELDGTPYADSMEGVDENHLIKRILPEVTKINF